MLLVILCICLKANANQKEIVEFVQVTTREVRFMTFQPGGSMSSKWYLMDRDGNTDYGYYTKTYNREKYDVLDI